MRLADRCPALFCSGGQMLGWRGFSGLVSRAGLVQGVTGGHRWPQGPVGWGWEPIPSSCRICRKCVVSV